MAVLKNRAKMSTSTTGTGTITLGSAEAGYQTFADAGVANGNVVRYVIEDGNNFEIGTGTYTSSGTTLTRTVSESSNSNNAINLSGSAIVFIGATAEDIQSIDPIDTTKFTATAGQTVFTGTWEADNISVFLNGVKLPDSDVIATDTQITISACLAGDIVEVVEYSTSAGGSSGSGSGVTVHTNQAAMLTDAASASEGSLHYETANNKLYVKQTSGFFLLASITNTAPTVSGFTETTGSGSATTIADNGTFALTSGSNTVITLTATEPDLETLVYSATVTSGTASNVISSPSLPISNQSGNTFTLTPVTSGSGGTITIRFDVSDGNNVVNKTQSFSIAFVVLDSNHTTLLATATGTSDNNNITDSSSNSHSITVTGDAHAGTFSPYRSGGYSTYFDGSGDSLNTTATQIIPSTSFTATAWVYLNDTTDGAVWGQGTSGHSGRTGVTIDSGNWFAQIGSANLGASTSVSANRWYYTDLQWDGSTLKFFVDGTLLGSVSNSNSPTNSAFYIGDLGSAWSTGYPLNGYVFDFKIVSGTPSGSSTVPTKPLSSSGSALHICHLPYIADGSTNDRSITINGDPETKPFSPYDYEEYSATDHGGSVYFDGNQDYILGNSGTNLGTANWTVEGWMYITDTTSDRMFIDFRPFTNGDYVTLKFESSDSKIYFIANNSNRIASNDLITANSWFHIALVRSSGTIKMYINGKVQTQTYASTANYLSHSSRPAIGIDGDNTTAADMYGYISDVRVAIGTAHYTTDFIPPTAPLSSSGAELHIKGTDASIIDKSQVANLKLEGSTTGSTDQVRSGAWANTKTMKFDGTGDYILTPTSDLFTYGTGNFTIECWVYIPSHPSNYSYLFGQGNSNSNTNSFGVYIQNGVFKIWNGGNIFTGTTSYSLNTWTHIAVSRSGNSLNLYINGNQEGSSVTNTSNISTGSSNGIEIARWIGISDPEHFTGYIQDLRVTKGKARYIAPDETSNIPSAPLKG